MRPLEDACVLYAVQKGQRRCLMGGSGGAGGGAANNSCSCESSPSTRTCRRGAPPPSALPCASWAAACSRTCCWARPDQKGQMRGSNLTAPPSGGGGGPPSLHGAGSAHAGVASPCATLSSTSPRDGSGPAGVNAAGGPTGVGPDAGGVAIHEPGALNRTVRGVGATSGPRTGVEPRATGVAPQAAIQAAGVTMGGGCWDQWCSGVSAWGGSGADSPGNGE